MIDRGTQKKMIVLKRTGSPYFSEAYFILREDCLCELAEESDMASEAERIIMRMDARRGRELKRNDKKDRDGTTRHSIWFLSGLLCGVGLSLILSVIFR